MDIILAVALSAVLIFATLKKKAFTPAAATTAGVILVTTAVCGSFAGIFIVIAAYGAIFAVDLIVGRRSERITGQINKKSGARDIVQVLVNAICAVVSLIIGRLTDNGDFAIVYAVALTECLADSLASDVGVLSKKDPVDICKFRRIPRGISGGVSALGTLAALGGSLFMSLFTMIFFGFEPKIFLSILLLPLVGITVDSILGSLIQVKYTCTKCKKLTEKPQHCDTPCVLSGGVRFITNDAVNFISNLITTALAVLVLIIL